MASKRTKIAAAGLGTMVVLGGGAAFAESALAAPTAPTGPAGTHAGHAHHGGRLLHEEKTYIGKDNAPMTLTVVSGSVTAVSATSITVTASDGYPPKVFAVNDSTKVARVDLSATPKRTAAAIGDVKTGDSVIVGGRAPAGTDAAAARIIIRP
jgi:hypothetical protein